MTIRAYRLKHRKPVEITTLAYTPKHWCYITRRIRNDYIGDARISTVFLNIPIPRAFQNAPPVLFETAIFIDDDCSIRGRCTTHREALRMHRKEKARIKLIYGK